MSGELLTLAQHALALAVLWLLLRVWFAIDRHVLRGAVMILFCLGQYGWALLVFVMLCIAERAHWRSRRCGRPIDHLD